MPPGGGDLAECGVGLTPHSWRSFNLTVTAKVDGFFNEEATVRELELVQVVSIGSRVVKRELIKKIDVSTHLRFIYTEQPMWTIRFSMNPSGSYVTFAFASI